MTASILHIAQDDKFINAAFYLFEKAFPGANRFVILKPAANPPTRYISEEVNAQFEVRSADVVNKLVEMSCNHYVTVLHGLDRLKGSVFLKSPHKDRFMSMIYGAEIYNQEIIGDEFIDKETKKFYDLTQKNTVYDTLKEVFRSIRYFRYEDITDIDLSDILYEMNVFGSFPSLSYQKYIDVGIYNPSVKKVPFSYYPIEFIIRNEDLRASGKNILLGNSASATNNHIEAFNLLKNNDLNGRKIIAPLSYGKKKYAREVILRGNNMFHDNFEPLTRFLPIEEYNKIIASCGFVIMNHYRPQAMGNIIASLFMGAKVFVNDTDAYRYFKKLNCYIYLIEQDMINSNDPFQLLTDEQIEHNRSVLKGELSTPNLVNSMRLSFSELFGFNTIEKEKV